MKRNEIQTIKARIKKAERRIAQGKADRLEQRGQVSEQEIKTRLEKRLAELTKSGYASIYAA